jgi:RNA-directed DNA polymerase
MRGKQHPDLNQTKAKLYRKQQGKCAWCALQFQTGELLEVDHIIPRSMGGVDAYYNKQLLHRHCHDEKTALDKSKV